METRTLRTRLSASPATDHPGIVLEAWVFSLVWLMALAWYRTRSKVVGLAHRARARAMNVRNVGSEVFTQLRRARHLARSARLLSALDSARLSQRYPLSPPPSYRLSRLVPRMVSEARARIPGVVSSPAHLVTLQASMEMDPPFVSDLELSDALDDDEPTVIDHFISPSARVIDQRR